MFTKKAPQLSGYFSKKNISKQLYFTSLQKQNTLFTSKNINPTPHLKKNLNSLKKKFLYAKNLDSSLIKGSLSANDYIVENPGQKELLKKQRNLITPKFLKEQSGLQRLTLNFKKKKAVINTLSSVKLKTFTAKKVTPLLQFVVNKVKRSYLQQLKYKKSKFSKFYKGPRPRIFSKKQKKNFALVFYLSKFKSRKSRNLRFIYLKRFFRWYFLLSQAEIVWLRKSSFNKKHFLFHFVKLFESRLVNVLLRTKMVFNPQILFSLFKLGAISVNNNVIKYSQFILKPLDVIFLNSSLIPYSFYRYFYSKFRAELFSKDLEKLNRFVEFRNKTVMSWHWFYSYKHMASFNRFKKYKYLSLNWNLNYVYLNRKLSCCVFLRNPVISDFFFFFKKQPRLLYNFLLYKY